MIRACSVLLMDVGALGGNILGTLSATSVAVTMVGRLVAFLIRAIPSGGSVRGKASV